MDENMNLVPKVPKSAYKKRMQRKAKLQKNICEKNSIRRSDSRPYVRTSIANFDKVTPSQKLTSCNELLSEGEFHIADADLIECCNKLKQMTKEENNIDAPEGARGDKTKKKTIVDIIFGDFSTTPFNSPTASPEKNLERSPLFILREKPKHCYSRKEKVKSNLEEKFKAALDGKNDKHLLNDSISESKLL
uniref:Uncharacterized protein n=1 Tax=Glossina austeni TaxID=7395 RepID=A0A1A9UDM4_GLOAU